MVLKDVILPVLSFVLLGLIVYWRENRKAFQERIFEYKYLAYKEIIENIGMFHQKTFEFLDSFQHFEGTQQEWQNIFLEESSEYYSQARELDRFYFRYLTILPEHQLNLLRDIIQHCSAHVTAHIHFDSSIPHESHDQLWKKLMDFAEESRKDLSSNVLNITLNKRLTKEFYPISFPVSFNRKGDRGQEQE